VDVSGVRVEFRDGDQRSVVEVDRLKVGQYTLRSDDQVVPVALDLHWDGRPIAGSFEVRFDGGTPGVAGSLVTGLLDLAQAQRLARLEPQVIGEVEFDGRVAWDGDRAEVEGTVAATRLQYQIGGRGVSIQTLAMPAFRLDLDLEPGLEAELHIEQPLTADTWQWSADGQGVFGEGGTLKARVVFQRGGVVQTDDVLFQASQLAWNDKGRSLAIEALQMAGRASQQLRGDAVLPGMALTASLGRLQYADVASALELEVEGLSATDATLSADGEGPLRRFAAQLASGPVTVRQGDTALQVESFRTASGGMVSLDSYQVDSDVAVQSLSVATPALSNGPLSLDGLELDGLAITERIMADDVRLRGIALPGGLEETALRVAGVDVKGPDFDPAANRLTIGDITIDGLQTAVIRDQAGTWRHVMTPADAAAETRPSAPAGAVADGPGRDDPAIAWRLGGIRITGDSHVTLADQLNPDMQPQRYRIERVEVGEIDTARAGSETPFALLLRPDQYSEFAIDGAVRPLDEQLYFDAAGHLHGFDLKSVNGLIANDLGHRFLNGQFDNDFEIKIAGNRLEMANQLRLTSVDVEELPDKQGPPLGIAIALLEDRDGNIKLDVPVEGDLSDPGFRVLGALDPIIMKAVAGAAALAIQPLGSVLVVGGLVADQAMKVTFQPAVFEPGALDLNGDARAYLDQLAEKLKERPKLAVRVCGLYAAQERERDKDGKFTDQPEQLLALAQQRADAVKAYMREQGVNAKQLRRCRPALDPTEAGLPRVDIRF
jgi:hypothetical protein